MSPRTWLQRVQDILDAIAEIQSFIFGMDFESFADDEKTIRAVEMNLIIIGEASREIPEDIVDAHPEIPWHLMRAMRNRLAHVYFTVDETLLWETVHDQLPVLIPPLQQLLSTEC